MRAVEEIGIQPVPQEQRTGTWVDLFTIIFAFGINPLYFVLGAIAVAEFRLPLWWAVGCAVVAQVLSYSILTTVSRVGCDYGIPGQVALRAFLGIWGARALSSGYRTVAALYWFATQAITAAYAIRALAGPLAGVHLRIVPVAVVLAALQALLAVLGFDVLRYVTRVVLPLGLAFVGVTIGLYLTSDDPRFAVGRVFHSPDQHLAWTGLAGYLTLMVASQLTFLPSIADFTRYTRSRRDTHIGLYLSTTLSTIVTTFVGGYVAAAIGTTKSPFEIAPSLTASKAVLAFLLLALIVQSTAVNIGNAYNVGMSLVNAVPRLGRVLATGLGACVGIAVAAVPDLLTSASDWITRLGSVAAPLAGVVLVEYLLVKRQRIDVPALFDPLGPYRYVAGVNVAAMASIAAGVVVYSLLPDELVKVAWGGSVAALTYLVLQPLQQRWLRGARPG